MRSMKMTVLATPASMESARMALMSTSVCAPQDTQELNVKWKSMSVIQTHV